VVSPISGDDSETGLIESAQEPLIGGRALVVGLIGPGGGVALAPSARPHPLSLIRDVVPGALPRVQASLGRYGGRWRAVGSSVALL